jgi:heterodisulfide reductase subunit B
MKTEKMLEIYLEFIKENKEELDRCIQTACPNCKLNNEERRLWILNDEGLYRWARSEGVKI